MARDQSNSAAQMHIYSGLNYTEGEGEYYGLQIAMVPFKGGQKILWRSAGGYLDEPILLNGVTKGGVITVQVPNDRDDAGTWTLRMQKDGIHADGPRGLKFKLKELPLH